MVLKKKPFLSLEKKLPIFYWINTKNTTERYEAVQYAVDKRQRIPMEF